MVWGLFLGLIHSLASPSWVRNQTRIILCEESVLNSSGIHLVRKTCAVFFIKFPWKNNNLNSSRGEEQVSLNYKLEDFLFLLK